ncbi:hypothetical protein [Merdimmobilis hominis]|uniref:hypothetical protein n=1 Tax=Merdimmobilis hominis TaxID=2897707 RepID=UPI001160D5C5
MERVNSVLQREVLGDSPCTSLTIPNVEGKIQLFFSIGWSGKIGFPDKVTLKKKKPAGRVPRRFYNYGNN